MHKEMGLLANKITKTLFHNMVL